MERQALRRLLLCLWLLGGVFYAVSTGLFIDTIYFSGQRESRDAPISPSTAGATPSPATPISEPGIRTREIGESCWAPGPIHLRPIHGLLRCRRLPMRLWTMRRSGMKEQSERFESSLFGPNSEEAVRLKVRSAANIRSGPSSRAVIIGTAQAGAELEVVSREAGWIRFVDPATSNTGWIYEGLLDPLTADSVPATTERSVTASADESAKPKAKGHTRKVLRPDASRRAPKQQFGIRPSFSRYAELPSDEELRPRKRGLGSFGRRRMLQQDLLNGSFARPQ